MKVTDLTLDALQSIILRDLDKLASEISVYLKEELIWTVKGDIKNPAGNLCLHLCGNLQHFIGAVLGESGYIRDRENEFAAKNISRAKLLKEIEQTKKVVQVTLPAITESQLQSNYPIDVFGSPMTTLFFLIHLASHLGYHLGQVNYHRRLVS